MAGAMAYQQLNAKLQGLTIAPSRTVSRMRAASAPVPQRRCRLVVQARTFEVGVGVFGTKAGMTQMFTASGSAARPATVIAIEPGNIVTQVKTRDTDGYDAVQVGYRIKREDKVNKPERGHLAKHNAPPMRHLREFKLLDGVENYTPGQQLMISEMFKEGDLVDVAGTSTGKGFQGSIKRWGMARGNMTHGSKSKRQHGSIGMCATPSRVFPGLKMAGQMGNKRIKTRKLRVIKVDQELNAIVLHGSVPGKPGNLLEITPAKIVGQNFKYQRHLTRPVRNIKAEVSEELSEETPEPEAVAA